MLRALARRFNSNTASRVHAFTGIRPETQAANVTICKVEKSVMQSGSPAPDGFFLKFDEEDVVWQNPLMGWTATSSPRAQRQLRLEFDSLEDAEAYCSSQGMAYMLDAGVNRRSDPLKNSGATRPYAKNFAFQQLPEEDSDDEED